MGNLERGKGNNSPITTLSKFKKYKGGRKCHTMATPSSLKMFE
jgi:hypothetical protein